MMIKQNCPDECPICGGRDYVSPGVLEEAARNGFDFHTLPPSCPIYLEAQLEKAREEAVHWKANHDQQVRFKRVTAEKRDEFQAERDAAIERGVELWEVLYHYTLHSSTVRRLLEQAEAKINKLRPSGWGQV